MYYATFNENRELSGRYSTLTHAAAAIPADAIEVPEQLYFQTIRENDGVWSLVAGKVVKRPIQAAAPDLPLLIANERFRREASGITVDGLVIETTRDSQALIASTGLSAVLDPDYRCNFETAGGFVEIGAAQIITIAKAVRAHVQACFDRKFALLRAIEAGEYSDDMLSQGWPDSSPPAPEELQ